MFQYKQPLINNVGHLITFNNHWIYGQLNGSVTIHINDSTIKLDNTYHIPYLMDDNLFIIGAEGSSTSRIFSLTTLTETKTYEKVLHFRGKENGIAWGIINNLTQVDAERFTLDTATNEIKSIYPLQYGINGIWHVINEDLFISKKGTILALHELATGNEVWRFDVESLGIWEDFGGASSYKIYIFRYHEPTQTILVAVSGHKLFALDAFTGAVKWRFDFKMPTVEMTIDGSELFVRNPAEYYYVFDISSGKVISEVDLSQSWLSQREMFSSMQTNPVIYKDYLLMTDCYRMRVGIFDKYSCELIDSTLLEGASGMIPFSNVLQMQGNRLYQIDAEDNLHILEWEK